MQERVENTRQICQIKGNTLGGLMSAYLARRSPEFGSLACVSKAGHGYAHL